MPLFGVRVTRRPYSGSGRWTGWRRLSFPANTMHHHDVSILIAIGRGDGWCLGVWPRLNTSMMRMRLPQQGQGGLSVSSAASPLLLASAEVLGTGMSRSLRAVAMHSALAEPAKRP